MKFMYICGNLVSTDHKSIMMYFHALGDNKEKEISFREVDFYLSDMNENILPLDMVNLFKDKNISTANLKAVYDCKDPRLEHIFVIYKIPGIIKVKKELRSYVTCSYDPNNKSFISKKYYLNTLIHEIQYDLFNFIIKSTYYGHNKKINPITVTVSKFDDYTRLDYDNGNMKKNEYNFIDIDFKLKRTYCESRKNINKDWYNISKHEHTYNEVHELINKIPKLNYRNFCNGNEIINVFQY